MRYVPLCLDPYADHLSRMLIRCTALLLNGPAQDNCNVPQPMNIVTQAPNLHTCERLPEQGSCTQLNPEATYQTPSKSVGDLLGSHSALLAFNLTQRATCVRD